MDAELISAIVYLSFIILGPLASIILYKLYKNSTIDITKLDKLVSFVTTVVFTSCIAFAATLITNIYKERETDLSEMKLFKEYGDKIVTMELKDRMRYSKFISIMCPKGELKNSWKIYYNSTLNEFEETNKLANQNKLDSSKLETLKVDSLKNSKLIGEIKDKLENQLHIINFMKSPIITTPKIK